MYKRSKQKVPFKYIGETKNQLRHGHGVYVYENKFFRYEGQWKNGRKHGHGKLILGDGGYYEGAFASGEIEGHGYRVFGLTGATYSGQFHHGEMNGQGILRYPNGEQYEGTWVEGKKEGSGILTGADGSVYEGGFHNNVRHGEGIQMYSNGDQYDGDWVMGKRHGNGMLRSAQGTIYDGQWRGDVYHGQGSIMHSSGVTFEGMWINGRPACEPVQLRVPGGDTEVLVEQGKKFTIAFECVDSEGQVVSLESGRSFEVTAAVRMTVTPRINRSKSRLQQMTAQTFPEMPSIQVPFGYSAQSYELLQAPLKCHSNSSSSISPTPVRNENPVTTKSPDKGKKITFAVPESTISGEGGNNAVVELTSKCSLSNETSRNALIVEDQGSSNPLHAKSSGFIGFPPHYRKGFGDLSKPETQSLVLSSKSQDKTTKEDEFLSDLITPLHSHVKEGKGVFEDLYLPPLPAPDISHALAPLPSKTSLPQVTSSSMSNNRDTMGSLPEDGETSPKYTGQGTKSSKTLPPGSEVPLKPPSSPSHSLASSECRKRFTGQESSARLRKGNSKATELSKDKLFHGTREKYCPTGTYIIIITEVTEPPFLETRLPELYVEVKVIPPKNVKSQDGASDKLIRSKTKLKWK